MKKKLFLKLRLEKLQRQQQALKPQSRFTEEYFLELKKVEQERIQADRERKLGIKSKSNLGIRFEDTLL